MKILVVDDAAVMRKVLIRELIKLNFSPDDITQASDGLEACKAVQRTQFDLIMMDWNMPNMLGIDAVREIRKIGVETPVLMITTEGERANIIAAIQAGATNYMVKPFTEETFQLKVRQLLPELDNDATPVAAAESNAAKTE